jgi:hypothetical protein
MLIKQKLYVPLTEGLNNRKDDRFLVPGEVKVLENGVYRKEGRIDKKLGFTNLTKNIFGGGTLSEAKGVYSLGDELIVEADDKIYSYSENSTAWVDKGTFLRTSVETEPVVRTNLEQSEFQFATIGNIRLCVWYDTEIRYSVQDTQTKVFYVYGDSLTASTATDRPRVLTIGTTFYIFYRDEDIRIEYVTISATTPTIKSSETTVTGTLANPGLGFGAVTVGTDTYIAWNKTGDILAVYKYANGDFSTAVDSNEYSASFVASDVSAIAVTTSTVSGTTYIHVAWQNTTPRMYVRILDTDLNEILANANFTPTAYFPLITGVQADLSSHVVRWFASNLNSDGTLPSSNNNKVYTGTAGPSGVVVDMDTSLHRFRIVTNAFRLNDRVMVGIVSIPTDQRCLFFIDSSLQIITKVAAGEAGIGTNSRRPTPVEISGDSVTVGFYQLGEYKIEDNVGKTVEGLAMATINFDPEASCSVTKLNDVLYFSSGVLKVYDGVSIFDDNFPQYPIVTNVYVGTFPDAGDVEPGDYQYTATYEWLDNKGNLHRSAPAIPSSFANAGDYIVHITVANLALSEKVLNGRSDIKIVIWRTDSTGAGAFYRVGDIDNAAASGSDVTFDDNVSNDDLTAREILYTQGGVIENIQAPAATAITNHKNHLVITGLEDAQVVRSSKPAFRHEAPGFNEGLEARTASEGGRNVTVASMDDKLVIFKENAIYYCVGDGPDLFGGGMFTSPQLVSDTIGCPYKNSVVLTTDGLMFQSSQGIYLLSRGLELLPIGDAVEDYTDSEVVNAVKIKDQNEVRFCQANGNMLVYNFDFRKWSVFPDKDCVGSTIWQDKHVIVTSDAQVSYEDTTTHLDNAVFVPIKATTGWIQLDEIAGLQRIYKVQLVGEYLTPHRLTLDISYDQNDGVVETHQLTVSANPTEYIYECRPRRQKCNSIQFTIRDVAPLSSTGTGQGLAISGLRLVVGTKTRLSNLPNTRRL